MDAKLDKKNIYSIFEYLGIERENYDKYLAIKGDVYNAIDYLNEYHANFEYCLTGDWEVYFKGEFKEVFGDIVVYNPQRGDDASK